MIELLTTIAVSAVLLAVAVPGFTHLVLSNRLAETANGFVNSLNEARMQAVRSNQQTAFCSNSTPATTDAFSTPCSASGGAVYAMNGSAVDTTPLASAPALPTNVLLGDGSNGTTSVMALRYSGDGLARAAGSTAPYSGLVADIYTLELPSDNHRCIYLVTGSSVTTCTLSDACPGNAPAACQ